MIPILQTICIKQKQQIVANLKCQVPVSSNLVSILCRIVMYHKQNLDIIGNFIEGEDGDAETPKINTRLGKLGGVSTM
eukprot:EST46835.1 Hypothetical protein SS50377_13133 [Spironucleus salmonicida]